MTVDYNIVVLGDGAAARYGAVQARQHLVRVALVQALPGLDNEGGRGVSQSPAEWQVVLAALRHFNYSRYVYQHGPYNLGTLLFQQQAIAPVGSKSGAIDWAGINWAEMVRSLPLLASASTHPQATATLEQLGIDVIQGQGQFVADPQLGFQVETGTTSQRLLRAKSYLIALDGQAIIPAIAGIESLRYHTLDTFFQPDTFVSQPQSVLILSDRPEGVEVANVLANLGTQVTLVMPSPQLLPLADAEVNQWVQSSLDASGVRTYLGATVNQIYPQDQGCVAELDSYHPLPQPVDDQDSPSPGPTRLKADELLVVMGRQVDFTTLNLRAIAVDYTPHGITVDTRYRTSHHRIFAMGDAIDHSGAIAQTHHYQAEGAIALRHALFQGPLLHTLKAGLSLPPLANPPTLPVIVNTHPPAAWMGWSEQEARRRYGDRIRILYQPFQSLPQAQAFSAYIPHATAGFGKLIVLDNGQIVGVQIVGIQAEELVNVVAIAMHQSVPMDDLSQLYPPNPSLTADILREWVAQWERDRPNRQPRLSDWL
ncbi:MAG: FAD-dependent oxidoreductase, partial [Leptolyngbyaceae bacterium]|nr:FAD-dependent oxidoreductase [Leptolyngbyaceae bacterium]